MIVYRFPRCIFRVFPNTGGYCETIFDDGATVPAAPELTEDYARRAAEMGYAAGADGLERSCIEHEFLHNWLADYRGLLYSPGLWATAHGELSDHVSLQKLNEEEWVVREFQTWMNAPPKVQPHQVLEWFLSHSPQRMDWLRREATRLIRPEVPA